MDTSEGFAVWYQGTALVDAHELAQYIVEPSLAGFARVVWPMFSEMLRLELEEAAAVSPGDQVDG